MKNTQIFARQLRRSLTPAERRPEYWLRNRHFACYKFRRQHPVGPYILDFACCATRLAIELDGGQHDGGVPTMFAAPAGYRARDGGFYASGIMSLKSMKMRWCREYLKRLSRRCPHPAPLP